LKGESLLCDSKQKRKKAPLASEEDDFEADFKQFGDDSEVDDDEYEVEVLDVKPFAFAAAKTPLGRESAADADSVQSGQHTALQFTVTSRRQARAIADADSVQSRQQTALKFPVTKAGGLELIGSSSILQPEKCK
ncbi:hypothetical protein Taro_045798, partial [Colocasia esculenta]|nr:hypothetical protein [Colocasia esculenta]